MAKQVNGKKLFIWLCSCAVQCLIVWGWNTNEHDICSIDICSTHNAT